MTVAGRSTSWLATCTATISAEIESSLAIIDPTVLHTPVASFFLGAGGVIPGGADLDFVVELLQIGSQKAKNIPGEASCCSIL